ncbi:HET domain containing protein [Colletotrichum truncatum]|uniref:HET domain containing protein n=1 Tax=Colletotrichum truncatum TaxID=5467 RepID=A0ACC3YQI7_COLTU|nr:HET domain containing protein [Colletotrichum truncatum]KAF6796603.1 HET domain containing protein [Colletotrichum truncatum]
MGICLPVGDCTKDQISLTDNPLNSICDTTNNNSNNDAIASASKILSGAVAKATTTASSTSKPKATNAASPLGQSIELALVIAAAAVIL